MERNSGHGRTLVGHSDSNFNPQDSPIPSVRGSRKKKGRLYSCKTCRDRKQKCGRERPICSTCRLYSRECIWAEGTPVWPLTDRGLEDRDELWRLHTFHHNQLQHTACHNCSNKRIECSRQIPCLACVKDESGPECVYPSADDGDNSSRSLPKGGPSSPFGVESFGDHQGGNLFVTPRYPGFLNSPTHVSSSGVGLQRLPSEGSTGALPTSTAVPGASSYFLPPLLAFQPHPYQDNQLTALPPSDATDYRWTDPRMRLANPDFVSAAPHYLNTDTTSSHGGNVHHNLGSSYLGDTSYFSAGHQNVYRPQKRPVTHVKVVKASRF